MKKFINSILIWKCLLVIGISFLSASQILAQNVRQIEILNADTIRTAKKLQAGTQKLIGNVRFKHDNAIMICDSAYFYTKSHSLDAFSNVKIEQGDTLFLYGDRLHYEGETHITKIRDNVKLVDDSTVLLTDYLDYNRETEIAYYLNGGVINEGENKLSSDQGYYFVETEIFHFKDNVVIVNPDYTIYSDTLEYNTKTKITYFFGPTEIIGEDNYLYCESGWYDTDLDISLMDKNAFLKSDGRILSGDTLYYERNNGFGSARSNVELFDSAQNIILKGNKGIYYEADQLATLSDSALMIQIDGPDSLFVHADTLRSIADTSGRGDSKILLAYYKVKFFRQDIQGMCDSLAYIEKDSTFHLHGTPIIWADENQITASNIKLKNRDGQLHTLFLNNIALLIQMKDTIKYNQIRGKNMIGSFKENKLVRLDVTGNGQTIYYAEDQGVIIGVNRAECSDLIIYLKNNKVSKVNYLVKPTGKYYPLHLFPENQRYLDGFTWNQEWRPLEYKDVFYWK
jgi:lipopolysaccharide export system protein LptA